MKSYRDGKAINAARGLMAIQGAVGHREFFDRGRSPALRIFEKDWLRVLRKPLRPCVVSMKLDSIGNARLGGDVGAGTMDCKTTECDAIPGPHRNGNKVLGKKSYT